MRKTAIRGLIAAAVVAGSGAVAQVMLPGLVDTARAQGVAGWGFIGPQPLEPAHNRTDRNWGNSSGRITSVGVAPNRPRLLFIGAAGGGVWKSEDGGRHWRPLTDNILPGQSTGSSMAIGALWVDRTGRTVYAGTGELNGSDSQYGQGVLRSRDGGNTWTVTGRRIFGEHFIGEIAANRNAPNTVLAASDQGVYRSVNGGQLWRKIGQLNSRIPRRNPRQSVSGQVYEIHQDPTNPRKYWASFGDRCESEAGGIATSDNGGLTWKVVFSRSNAGRIGLGVGARGVAYAAVASCNGALLSIQKTTNGGTNWRPIPRNTPGYGNYFLGNPQANDPNGQGDYDNVVGVDPTDSNRVVFGGVTILATSDGGKRFTNVGRVYSGGFIHPDFHAFAFTGRSSFYVGNDGGLYRTMNLGGNGRKAQDWINLNTAPGSSDKQGLRITQFNQGTSLSSANLLGGTQDNGTPAATPGVPPALPAMGDITSGDGGYTAIDPTSPHTVYTAAPGSILERWTGTGANRVAKVISPCVPPPNGQCTDRVGFYFPFVMDLSNPQRLLVGTNRVIQTLDARADVFPAWAPISGRLTRTDQGFLSSIALPRTGGDTIFTASNDGEVARTTNAKDWTDITGNLPRPGRAFDLAVKPLFTQVTFNPANPSQAWVTIGRLGVGQVWYTSNAGAAGGTHWVNLSGTGATALPAAPALSVVEVPGRPGTIDVGTYYGVWTCSTCGGQNPKASWRRLGGTDLAKGALPKVEVDWLSVTLSNNSLIAWTHGRGIWRISLG